MTQTSEEQGRAGSVVTSLESGLLAVEGKVFGEEEGGGMHIVGMHAHAAHHRHNHSQGQGACDGNLTEPLHSHDHGHEHGHSHGPGDGEGDGHARHVVVSQVNLLCSMCCLDGGFGFSIC